MVTVVCDATKISVLLDQASQCPTVKNIVKIGPPVSDEEKSKGDKFNVNVINFSELEVRLIHLYLIINGLVDAGSEINCCLFAKNTKNLPLMT